MPELPEVETVRKTLTRWSKDKIIKDVVDMQQEIYSHNIGDTVTIEYYRYGILNTANVILNK